MKRSYRYITRRQRGFTMLEVMFCMIIFLAMTFVFAAVFPFAVSASKFSNNYSQASMIAQHKLDQIHRTSWSNLNSTNLTNLGIVDSGTCTNDSGGGIVCSFTNTDNIADNGTYNATVNPPTWSNIGYFPHGSSGTVNIDPDLSTGVPTNTVDNVTVTVSWQGGGMSSGSYVAATKVVELPHQ